MWLLAAAAFYGVFIARTRFLVGGTSYFSLFDDAMISMRYARNIASGLGPVWNPGDAPIEGFTNPLWTLWMAALHATGLPESKVSLAVMVSGACLLMLAAWLAGRLARSIAPESRSAEWASVWGTALCYPLVFWTLRGMEVGLLAVLVGAAALAVVRVERMPSTAALAGAALLLAALAFARPDGAVPAVALSCGLLLPGRRRPRLLAGVLLVVAIGASVAVATAMRVAIFGDPFPNTYYLKMTGVATPERLRRGLSMMFGLFAVQLWPLVLLAALNGRKLLRPPLAPLTLLVASQLAYSVYVGGDAWEWMRYANRYVSVVLPVLIVLAALGASRVPASGALARRLLSIGGLGGGSVLLVLAASVCVGFPWQPSFFQREPAFRWAVAGVGLVGSALLLVVGAAATSRGGGLRAQLEEGIRRLASWNDARVGTAIAVVMLVWLSGPGLAHWALTRGVHVHDDAVMTRIGIRVREATDPHASIAVTWAGAIPYFAHRHAIDLFGMSDRKIAHEHGRGAFFPGHNKWDIGYSIGALRPDVIVQLPVTDTGDVRMLGPWGYAPLTNTMYVRSGTHRVDRTALDRPVSTSVP